MYLGAFPSLPKTKSKNDIFTYAMSVIKTKQKQEAS